MLLKRWLEKNWKYLLRSGLSCLLKRKVLISTRSLIALRITYWQD